MPTLESRQIPSHRWRHRMSSHLPWKILSCGLAACLLFPLLLNAEVTGSVLGTVTDPSGATVANAVVILRNANTGLERRVQANSSGVYEFLAVPVGEKYSVRVEAPGFRATVQTDIKLEVNQKYRADFRLEVGAVTQTIEVSAATTQVDTTSTQIGDVIGEKKLTSLPLNGRSYIDLLGLQAGVVPISSDASQHDRFVSGNGDSGQVSVNGQRETSNSFNAEYGRFSGAIVNVITKSGTNQIHGSAYEFLRNEKLDARNYFDTERGAFKRNQFGGT